MHRAPRAAVHSHAGACTPHVLHTLRRVHSHAGAWRSQVRETIMSTLAALAAKGFEATSEEVAVEVDEA